MKDLFSGSLIKNNNPSYTQLKSIMQNILAQAKKGKNLNFTIYSRKTKFQSAWNQ